VTGVTYDDDAHAYALDGVAVPSVTARLTAAGLVDTTYYTADGCARGHQVHRATLDVDLGTFDPANWPADVLSRVRGYRLFLDDYRPRWWRREQPVASPRYATGGTPDAVGYLTDAPRHLTVIDVKGGAPAPWHALQTACYALLLEAPTARRFALYLLDTGTYRLVPHRSAVDIARAERLMIANH